MRFLIGMEMDFTIHANRVFGLNPVQPGLIARPGTMITFDVAEMVNVQMKCDFICDLQDTDPLYKKMIEEINKPKVVVGQFQGGGK